MFNWDSIFYVYTYFLLDVYLTSGTIYICLVWWDRTILRGHRRKWNMSSSRLTQKPVLRRTWPKAKDMDDPCHHHGFLLWSSFEDSMSPFFVSTIQPFCTRSIVWLYFSKWHTLFKKCHIVPNLDLFFSYKIFCNLNKQRLSSLKGLHHQFDLAKSNITE